MMRFHIYIDLAPYIKGSKSVITNVVHAKKVLAIFYPQYGVFFKLFTQGGKFRQAGGKKGQLFGMI